MNKGRERLLWLGRPGDRMAEQSAILRVLAPLSGVRVPLARVPDPVFAERMVGDGASLDPTSSTLLAPIDGEVVQLHAAHHAITLRHRSGVAILIHIGLDTVSLRGAGFTPMVRVGDRVTEGQGLIRFDLDQLALSARSLLTQVVVADGAEGALLSLGRGPLEAGKSVLFSLRLGEARDARIEPPQDSLQPQTSTGDAPATSGASQRTGLRLPNPSGLHARPAAVLAKAAQQFRAEIKLAFAGKQANAKSVVSLLGLGTVEGSEIELRASGADAHQAIEVLAKLLAEGCGEDLEAARAESAKPALPTWAEAATADGELAGVPASPGLAIGQIFHWRRSAISVREQGDGAAQERRQLEQAIAQAKRSLEALQHSLADAQRRAILASHQQILDDPDLLDAALGAIDQGKSAAYAWQSVVETSASTLAAMDNTLLAERALDLRDVGRRVLGNLVGEVSSPLDLPDGCILVAEDLTPSETAQLDRKNVRGFCTTGGGATGHVAILARSFGLPAICGIDPAALALSDGQTVILDGDHGLLNVAPSAGQLEQAKRQIERAQAQTERDRRAAQQPARLADGLRIEVVANVRHAADAAEALAAGAEGVGLLRSELLFDGRDTAPSEAEQFAAYAAVAACLGTERPLVIRTLDVGGDKPLSYLPMPAEDNPFLGMRGIRISLLHPQLFRDQVRAVLRACVGHRLHLMLPMVATLDEFRRARGLIEQEAAALDLPLPSLGIMVEVPSAALLADAFAREVDFMSVGSNDLTQYTLAMDRGHAQLAAQADALHPAVLRLIGLCGEAMERHDKWLGVCGALASDPLAAPALIGLGVRELSVVTPALAAVKAALSRSRLDDCRALAQTLLKLDDASAVRAELRRFQSASIGPESNSKD